MMAEEPVWYNIFCWVFFFNMICLILNSLNFSPFPRQIPMFCSSNKNWLEKMKLLLIYSQKSLFRCLCRPSYVLNKAYEF